MADAIYATRKQNLRLLIEQWGSVTTLSKKLGYANASYLVQLTGPSASRTVGEKAARDIEETLGLPPRWLDEEHQDADVVIDDEFLRECLKAVATEVYINKMKPDADTVANLSALAYEHCRAIGRIDKKFVSGLVDLIKPKH